MKNSKTHYLCLALLLITHFIYAQTMFREAYVIDLKNDTLIGDIDYRGDVWMGEKCIFKPKNAENITEYKPADIVGYRFKDDRFFIAKEIQGEKVFLEFLIKGKVNIYYFRNSSVERYFIEKEGEKLAELPYKEAIVYGSEDNPSATYLSQSNTHKIILKRYMKDVPKFQSRIDRLVKPEHDELIKLAKDYHNQVCKDEACIVYKKKIARTNVNVEIVGGVLKYSSSVYDVVKKNYPNVGILAHLWLPRVNEKLYLRTGIIYSKINILNSFSGTAGDNTSENSYKIPLQIEYIYPQGKVRPVFAYGFSMYKPVNFTAAVMGGLNVKLSKKITMGFNYDVDFFPVALIIPGSFFSQSALIGLKVKL